MVYCTQPVFAGCAGIPAKGEDNKMFRVRDLLRLPYFSDAAVVAGQAGLDRVVEDLSVMEVPDIEDYVRPGDFLLSTLYPFSDRTEELKRLIGRLDGAHLSGIGIKLNRYISDLPQELLQQADAAGFPVIVLPANSNFSMQINSFLKASIQQKNMELEHRNYIHEKLMEILLRGENPGDLARILSELLRRPVLLLDQHLDLMAAQPAAAETLPLPEIRDQLRQSCGDGELLHLTVPEGCAAAYRVRYGKEEIGCMILRDEKPVELSQIELITLQQFAIVFRIMSQHRIVMENREYRNREAFAYDLIYGNIVEEEIAVLRARLLKWELTFPMTLLLVNTPLPAGFRDRQELMELLQKRIEWECFPNADSGQCPVFWAESQGSLLVFFSCAAMEKVDSIAARIMEILRGLKAERCYLALSREAASLKELPRCYRDGQYTLKLAQRMKREGMTRFRDLGIYRIINSAGNQKDLLEFCQDTIGPLLQYDRKHQSSLIETLESVMDHGGNLKAAAADLFIHYNTVRYRYHLAERLLGKDLNTAQNTQDITLALKVHHALENM